jgi:hypothetical protein
VRPLVIAAFLALIPLPTALADEAPPPPQPAPPSAACNVWDVEYTVAANVQLSDTTLGAGDGVHKIGPGRLVLRLEAHDGQLAGHVRMLVYDMTDGFTVVAKTLFWGTTVVNHTHTIATQDASGAIAEGTFTNRSLKWDTVVNGMRTDGPVSCQGSFCGKFGAPPEGTNEIHTAPHPVTFNNFEFDADKKTFTMAYAIVSKSETPRQTSRIALAGREVRRSCAPGK